MNGIDKLSNYRQLRHNTFASTKDNVTAKPSQIQGKDFKQKYINFVESKFMNPITNNLMGLTASVWIAGDFAKVVITAKNVKMSGDNGVSEDEKYTAVVKSISDCFTNIFLYWAPYFLMVNRAKKMVPKVLGENISDKVRNFSYELVSLIPISIIYYGIGSAVSAKLTQWIVSNKDNNPWFKDNGIIKFLMSLGEKRSN